MTLKFICLSLAVVIASGSVQAQKLAKNQLVYVDKEGVMRYTATNKEAAFYGVNYTVPFAYGYRSVKALNADLKQEIDKDVYHLARMGMDAFRVHVWDVEISDSAGNLLQNVHLDFITPVVLPACCRSAHGERLADVLSAYFIRTRSCDSRRYKNRYPGRG